VDSHVDLGGLAEAMRELGEFDSWWEDTLAELDTAIANLHVSWQGRTAAAHQDAYRRWSEGSAKMRDALAKVRDAGLSAHRNYSAASGAGTRSWSPR
jgi:WXG100 family type VII secretion target